jgi:glutathione S-transferase
VACGLVRASRARRGLPSRCRAALRFIIGSQIGGLQWSQTSYFAIGPLARVPALVTPIHGTITEAPAVPSYIADTAGLLPCVGTRERYEALSWKAYLPSTVHPAFGRLWRAERFEGDATRLA